MALRRTKTRDRTMTRPLSSPLHAVSSRLLLALAALLLGALLTSQAALAEFEGQKIYTKDGVAIGGTDPVAYFTEGKPMQGSPEFAAEYMGATWHFASAEHRDLFQGDPETYAPQYGGFCAFGVAVPKYKISTVPEAWSIVDGKLYLNYSLPTQERWQSDVPGYIAAADETWPNLK
jgi:YHS domain-containing protein